MKTARIGAVLIVLAFFAGPPFSANAQGFDGRWNGLFNCGQHTYRPEYGPFAWKLSFDVKNGTLTGRHDYFTRSGIPVTALFIGHIDQNGNVRIGVNSHLQDGREDFREILQGRAAFGSTIALAGTMLNSHNQETRSCELTLSMSAPVQPPVARVVPAAPVLVPQPNRSPQVQPQTPPVFVVFFDSDGDEIGAGGQSIIQQAADAWSRTKGKGSVRVIGYTDRSLVPDQSQQLSERRAQNVAAVLARLGVPDDRLFVEGSGESEPRIPTGPGVREPQNQRVELVILSERETAQTQKQREQEAKAQPAPTPIPLPDVPQHSVGSVALLPTPEPPTPAPSSPAAAPPAVVAQPAPAPSIPASAPPTQTEQSLREQFANLMQHPEYTAGRGGIFSVFSRNILHKVADGLLAEALGYAHHTIPRPETSFEWGFLTANVMSEGQLRNDSDIVVKLIDSGTGTLNGRKLPAGIFVLTAHLQIPELAKYEDECIRYAILYDEEFKNMRGRAKDCNDVEDINFVTWRKEINFTK